MIFAAVLSAWVQYAADGQPHARALAPRTCPALSYRGGSTPMRVRAGSSAGFDDVVCDAPVPAHAVDLHVENRELPAPPDVPLKVVVFGDTGCRMKDDEQQNCGDVADWPFPKIARTIAAVHPDLAIHVGDYYYRENNCPPSMKQCENRWGDTSMSWNADWFAPAAPLFASTALILARGNHEDCERGGPGWFRYLDGAGASGCTPGTVDGTPPWSVSFGYLRVVVGDSAADPSDSAADPSRIAFYKTSFAAAQRLVAGAPGDALFVTHRPPFANTNQTQALLALGWRLAPFDAILAGHVHDFEAIDLAGYPPLIVNGESGDDLDDAGSTAKYIGGQTNAGRPVYTFAAPPPFATKQFGFAVYTRTGDTWNISLRDADGIERRACSLAKGVVACP